MAFVECDESLLDHPLERQGIELIRPDSKQVSRRTRLEDRLARAAGRPPEELAKLGHVVLYLRHRCGRSGIRIEVVHDLVHGHDPVRVQEKDGQYRALPRPAEPDRAGVGRYLDRAEDAETERHPG